MVRRVSVSVINVGLYQIARCGLAESLPLLLF